MKSIFKPDFANYLNHSILKAASSIKYRVADLASNTEADLFNHKTLVIWSGASDNTLWNDKQVNWAFRAIHDACHLKSGLGFSVADEVTLGDYQSSLVACPYIRAITQCEITEQALYYKQNGVFVADQVAFTKSILQNNNLFKGVLNV